MKALINLTACSTAVREHFFNQLIIPVTKLADSPHDFILDEKLCNPAFLARHRLRMQKIHRRENAERANDMRKVFKKKTFGKIGCIGLQQWTMTRPMGLSMEDLPPGAVISIVESTHDQRAA